MREAGLGIDIGNGSISIAVVEGENIIYKDYRLHRGELYQNLVDMLGQVETSCGDRILYAAVNPGAVCLYPGIQKEVQINRISSLLEGQRMLYPDAGSIVEMGAQNSCFLTGMREGETLSYAMNGECAAGTGAFFEDQMYRLGLPLSAYSEYVRRAKSVPRLAGRCSVFAKTDLIHRQQEGVPVEDILLGLSYAVIRNFKSAVVRKLPVQPLRNPAKHPQTDRLFPELTCMMQVLFPLTPKFPAQPQKASITGMPLPPDLLQEQNIKSPVLIPLPEPIQYTILFMMNMALL